MHAVRVNIERFVDESFPGFVECSLVDVYGTRHTFTEKVPVVSKENLRSDTPYPQPGVIACEIQSESEDAANGKLVTISTEQPWDIESLEGQSKFTVSASEMVLI